MNHANPALRSLRVVAHALACLTAPAVATAYECPVRPPPAATADFQGLQGRVFERDGRSMPYRYFVPEGYDPSTPYPMVLYMHHSGLSGNHQAPSRCR